MPFRSLVAQTISAKEAAPTPPRPKKKRQRRPLKEMAISMGELISLYNANRPWAEISALAGLPADTLLARLRRAGVKHRKDRVTAAQRELIVDLYTAEVSWEDMVTKTGRSHYTIGKVLREEGMQTNRRGKQEKTMGRLQTSQVARHTAEAFTETKGE